MRSLVDGTLAIAMPDLLHQPGRNEFVRHPVTGSIDFHVFPEIRQRGDYFPEAPIRLRFGEHRGKNRGFGLAHVIAAHQSEIIRAGYPEGQSGAIQYVADILRPRADIYSEFGDVSGRHRATVVQTRIGMVVLDQRMKRDRETIDFYSVVTAYLAGPKGTRIGALR